MRPSQVAIFGLQALPREALQVAWLGQK